LLVVFDKTLEECADGLLQDLLTNATAEYRRRIALPLNCTIFPR